MASLPPVINTFMGLGYVFSDGVLPRVLRTLITPFLAFGVNQSNVHLVFSNRSDQDRLRRHGILRHDRASVLMSEFVDTDVFRPFSPERPAPKVVDQPSNDPVVLMAVRLLWAKGVGEFVEAARILRRRGVDVQFWLAGEPDTDSAGFVPEDQLREWEDEGLIEWLGYQTDMPTLFNQADIAVLPTKYNEGMPRFLVEAAACGLPIITTDQEACRIVVNDEENGVIIPTGDSEALANALERLIADRDYRKSLGKEARADAVRDFDEETGTDDWHRLYDRLLANESPAPEREHA
jgi:glycosyltransferase involved in cell wall biosynthesis